MKAKKPYVVIGSFGLVGVLMVGVAIINMVTGKYEAASWSWLCAFCLFTVSISLA